ncbi:LysR family transcriptional regulator [Pedococcus sp. 2YAF34]|uniref:LysR family transcriptional regulator n=1 Tax=Pedococcus sp. 2YAF34 TaxID=3233032 RepID=UPI003F9C7217
MELRHLEVFLAVVDHHGFRRASAHLYLSQSAVSARIHELEQELGARVFERNRKGAALTAVGAALVQPARRTLDNARAVRRGVELLAYTGRLTLGVMPGGAAELTRPLLLELARRFPRVTFTYRPVPMTAWHDGILGEVDLLVTREPFPGSEVVATELLREGVGVAVPASFSEADAHSLSLDDVMGCPMVRTSDAVPRAITSHWGLEHLANGFKAQRRGPAADGPLETSDRVEAGYGVAVGPVSVARMYGSGAFRFVPVTGVPDSAVALVSRGDDERELVVAVHRETADIVRRIAPLVLGGRSPGVDDVVDAVLRPTADPAPDPSADPAAGPAAPPGASAAGDGLEG